MLLVLGYQDVACGQIKKNLYADISLNEPGGSLTLDRKFRKHLQLGLGVHGYDFEDNRYNNMQFACYGDFRPYWTIAKRSEFFTYADLGIMVLAGRKPSDAKLSSVSPFLGLGLGYFYRINKRGMGPYISFGLNSHREHYHNDNMTLSPAARNYSVVDAGGVMSVGFRF